MVEFWAYDDVRHQSQLYASLCSCISNSGKTCGRLKCCKLKITLTPCFAFLLLYKAKSSPSYTHFYTCDCTTLLRLKRFKDKFRKIGERLCFPKTDATFSSLSSVIFSTSFMFLILQMWCQMLQQPYCIHELKNKKITDVSAHTPFSHKVYVWIWLQSDLGRKIKCPIFLSLYLVMFSVKCIWT